MPDSVNLTHLYEDMKSEITFFDEKFPHLPFHICQKLYEDMKNEIESAVARGRVPDNVRNQHKGFSEWNPKTTKQDHQPIVKVWTFLIFTK